MSPFEGLMFPFKLMKRLNKILQSKSYLTLVQDTGSNNNLIILYNKNFSVLSETPQTNYCELADCAQYNNINECSIYVA